MVEDSDLLFAGSCKFFFTFQAFHRVRPLSSSNQVVVPDRFPFFMPCPTLTHTDRFIHVREHPMIGSGSQVMCEFCIDMDLYLHQ